MVSGGSLGLVSEGRVAYQTGDGKGPRDVASVGIRGKHREDASGATGVFGGDGVENCGGRVGTVCTLCNSFECTLDVLLHRSRPLPRNIFTPSVGIAKTTH